MQQREDVLWHRHGRHQRLHSYSAKEFHLFFFHPQMLLFFKVGLCGGFTTFSTFALETADLMKAGQVGTAFLYVVLSVLAGVAVIFAVEYVTMK